MTWPQRALERCTPGQDLRPAVQRLFAQQRQHWALFRKGEQALHNLVTRRFVDSSGLVVAQANPRRKVSSAAQVDPASIAARPCFLCEKNLPDDERAVLCERGWALVPNPFPIMPMHLSIPNFSHQPQAIAGHVKDLLGLAAGLPGFAVFYNGPRCGASAPDHLHFQACLGQDIPALQVLSAQSPTNPQVKRTQIAGETWFGRQVLRLCDQDPKRLAEQVETAIKQLKQISGDNHEPMINLVASKLEDRLWVLIFPRKAHRPRHFFADPATQILISPGALDMAGVLVVAEPTQLDRLSVDTVHAIYDDVSLDAKMFMQWVQELQ